MNDNILEGWRELALNDKDLRYPVIKSYISNGYLKKEQARITLEG